MGAHVVSECRPYRPAPSASFPCRWRPSNAIQHNFSASRNASPLDPVAAGWRDQYRAIHDTGEVVVAVRHFMLSAAQRKVRSRDAMVLRTAPAALRVENP